MPLILIFLISLVALSHSSSFTIMDRSSKPDQSNVMDRFSRTDQSRNLFSQIGLGAVVEPFGDPSKMDLVHPHLQAKPKALKNISPNLIFEKDGPRGPSFKKSQNLMNFWDQVGAL